MSLLKNILPLAITSTRLISRNTPMNVSLFRNIPLAKTPIRLISRSTPRYDDEVQEVPSKWFKKLKADQKRFQVEDGNPVWLKNGYKDRILWQATLVTLAINLIMTVHLSWLLLTKP